MATCGAQSRRMRPTTLPECVKFNSSVYMCKRACTRPSRVRKVLVLQPLLLICQEAQADATHGRRRPNLRYTTWASDLCIRATRSTQRVAPRWTRQYHLSARAFLYCVSLISTVANFVFSSLISAVCACQSDVSLPTSVGAPPAPLPEVARVAPEGLKGFAAGLLGPLLPPPTRLCDLKPSLRLYILGLHTAPPAHSSAEQTNTGSRVGGKISSWNMVD